jgi:hypothetical protein
MERPLCFLLFSERDDERWVDYIAWKMEEIKSLTILLTALAGQAKGTKDTKFFIGDPEG